MSRIPSRNEEGEYNKSNLKGYDEGFITCFDYLIKEGIDTMSANIKEAMIGNDEENYTILDKAQCEVIDKFVEKLKQWLDMEADEFNCSMIENDDSE